MTELEQAPQLVELKPEQPPAPHLPPEEENIAIKRVNRASVAGYVSASITLLFGVAGLFMNSDNPDLAYYLDPWIIFDAVLIFALAFFVRRKSFPAAIILFVYFLFAKIIVIYETGKPSGVLLAVLFLYWFYGGILGARYFRQSLPVKKRSKLAIVSIWAAGIFVSLLIAIGTIITVMQQDGLMPAYEVASGASVPQQQKDELVASGILDADEMIDLFYSAGVLSILEDGNIVTDQRVISYWQEDEELRIETVLFEDIKNVVWDTHGSAIEDSIIRINLPDDVFFQLIVTIEDNGDKQFVRKIRQKMAQVETSQ